MPWYFSAVTLCINTFWLIGPTDSSLDLVAHSAFDMVQRYNFYFAKFFFFPAKPVLQLWKYEDTSNVADKSIISKWNFSWVPLGGMWKETWRCGLYHETSGFCPRKILWLGWWVVLKDIRFVLLPSLISHGTRREVSWEGMYHLTKLSFRFWLLGSCCGDLVRLLMSLTPFSLSPSHLFLLC